MLGLASAFEPRVTRIQLIDPPSSVEDGPAFLNLSRHLDMPQLVAPSSPRDVTMNVAKPAPWAWVIDLGKRLDPNHPWPSPPPPRVGDARSDTAPHPIGRA